MNAYEELFTVRDRSVVVTGAAQGIGEAIAATFHRAGARLVLVDYDPKRLEMVHERLPGSVALLGDVGTPQTAKEMVALAFSRFGSIDILVQNAGINRPQAVADITDDSWRDVLRVNLDAAMYGLRAALPPMRERKYGRVINISSVLGLTALSGQASYSVAKAGLIQLTRAAALEAAGTGVTVNAVAPGYVETPLTESVRQDAARYGELLRRIPEGRFARVEELVGAVLFLASPAASYVNGSVLAVDGGWTVW